VSSLAEALFYRLYNSYLLQKSDLIDNYRMIQELYQTSPKSLLSLSTRNIKRLKKVQEDILEGKHSLFSSGLNCGPVVDICKNEKTDKSHVDICLELAKNPHLLEPFTGPINYLTLEYPTLFGPIDLMVLSNKTAYIIEVKTDTANHAIIGQVTKYWIALSLRLSINHYDEVRIITACPGYDKIALIGLKDLNAIKLKISKPFSLHILK